MQLDPTRTVRELAIEIPGATRVFEKLNIDYCCGGDQPFGEACDRAGLTIQTVSRLLDATETGFQRSTEPTSFQSFSLARLSEYIVTKHHIFTRDELERLTGLLSKVCSKHGRNHPELSQIQIEFQTLGEELLPHMMKEENILFPYIARLEASVIHNRPAPFAPFGTVRNPIAVMMREHDAAGDILKRIRKLSKDFVVPSDACFSYRTLYSALAALEADLHEHIHLENNILFPRASDMEEKSRASMT